jgi:hypothetical protein
MSQRFNVDLLIVDEGIAPKFSLLVKSKTHPETAAEATFMIYLEEGTPKARAQALATLLGELGASTKMILPARRLRFGASLANAL